MKKSSQNQFAVRLSDYYTDKIYTLAEQKNLTPTEIVREIVQGWLSEDRNLMTSLQGQLTDMEAKIEELKKNTIQINQRSYIQQNALRKFIDNVYPMYATRYDAYFNQQKIEKTTAGWWSMPQASKP